MTNVLSLRNCCVSLIAGLMACSALSAATNAVLSVNNYFGGTGHSQGQAIVLDSAGNIYVAGDTDSTDFPATAAFRSGSSTTNAPRNIFVTKWNPAGDRLIYATWIGGSGFDQATGIAVDKSGSVYVIGVTSSPDFPITPSAAQKTFSGSGNSFVLKLSPDGASLNYSSFLGPSERALAIVVDPAGNAYIAGTVATSPGRDCTPTDGFVVNFPTSGDAFVKKLNSTGTALLFSTTVGGACGETGSSLAFDPSGRLWMGGTTWSNDFPITPGALQSSFGGGFGDGFLARFDAQGGVEYATYIGGAGEDSVSAMTFDPAGNMWLTGSSRGFSQPASPGAFQPAAQTGNCFVLGIGPPLHYPNGNAYVMKIGDGRTVARLTYLGSYCYNQATTIAVDSQGYPWIGGVPGNNQKSGYSMPTVSPFRLDPGSGFVSRFSPDLTQLVFSSWSDRIGGLAIDAAGSAWVTGTGYPGGNQKAVVAKIELAPSTISLDSITSLYSGAGPSITDLAPGKLVTLKGRGLGPTSKTPGVVTSSGLVSTVAGGVQVFFGGIAAPVLAVSSGEIQCAIPFGLAAGDTTVQVIYNGDKSNVVGIRLKPDALEVLTVFNSDFRVNSESNPAAAGSVITMYLTGAGQTDPASIDGKVNSAPLAPVPLSVRAILGSSTPVPVTFAAAAYGQVAGVIQLNFIAPSQPGQFLAGVSAAAGSETYALVSVK